MRRGRVVNEAIKKELFRIKRLGSTEKLNEYRDKGAKVSIESIVEAVRAGRHAL